MQHLISEFGYLAVFVGTMIEGGTLLTMAGFAAHRGYLLLPWVIAVGVVGNLIDGQLWFFAARSWGFRLARRRARWRLALRRMDRLYHRHPQIMVVAARFVPGLRTASYIAAGLTRLSALRYAILNAVGAGLWAATLGTLGFLFGEALQAVLGDVRRYERPALLTIAGLGLLWWAVAQLLERRKDRERIRKARRESEAKARSARRDGQARPREPGGD